jgi:hypothetical protein
MNSQIQEINTEIVNIQESVKPLCEKQSQLQKEIGQGIANYLIGRWRKVTGDVNNTPIVKVLFDQFDTVVRVKSNESENTGELRFYHTEQSFGDKQPYRLGWYSNIVTQDDLRHLFYLEMLGIVANEMRNHETSEFVKLINEGVGKVKAFAKLINKADLDISVLLDKRKAIERQLIVEEILKAGGVSHPQPVFEYIRNTSNYKTQYQHIVIGKTTDKTIELQFTDRNGNEEAKYRLPKADAINYLVNEYECIKLKEKEAEKIAE